MKGFSLSCRWALMLILSVAALAQPEAERVGPQRSEIRTFQFSGNATFSADQLRAGLISDSDFLIAAHPLAPLRPCVELLETKLARGYRVAGFPDVQIEANAGERFQVRIAEGARFMAGDVRVRGAKKLPVQTLIKRLTNQFPLPSETHPARTDKNVYRDRTEKTIEIQPPAWEKSKPARFGNEGHIEAQVRTILSELGFLSPAFAVRIEKAAAAGSRADLIVEFSDEGEAAVLSEIVIKGNEQNSRDELLQFLRLTNGMPATATLASDTEYLLYSCGRFKSSEARLEPIPPASARMIITLKENRFSPSLTTPYSRQEQAMLAFRKWLQDISIRRDVISGDIGHWSNVWIHAALGPEAVLASVEKRMQDGASYRFAALVSSNGAGLFSPGSRTKYFVPKPEMHTFAGVGLTSSKSEDTTSNIELFGGVKSRTSDAQPNFLLLPRWDPAPFLSLANPTNGTLAFEADALVLRTSNTVLRVEEKTGKLLALRTRDASYSAAVTNEQAISGFLSEMESYRNIYDPQRPHSTFFGYVAVEGFDAALAFGLVHCPSQEVSKRASAAVRKLIRPETFQGLDELLKKSDEKEQFGIPIDLGQEVSQNALAAILAGFVFRGANAIVPENSWPWTVAREAVFVLKGQSRYTAEQLDRLFNSREMGPVGFFVTTALLNRVQPELAKRFALRGLTRLQSSYFEEDCKLLFTGDTALSRSVARLAKDLQLLDQADLKALDALFQGSGNLLEKAAARARADANAPAVEVLSPLLEHFWDNHMKAVFRAGFQKVAFGAAGGEDLVPHR
jgi:hypothetical protein